MFTSGTARTNFFGDFEFEGQAEDANYTVRIEAKGYRPKEMPVKTTADVYLGVIVLERFDNS